MSSIFMRFPKGRAKALTLSYDDGVQQDIRLMSILNKYGYSIYGDIAMNSMVIITGISLKNFQRKSVIKRISGMLPI